MWFLIELAVIIDINNQFRILNLKLQRTNQNISQLVTHVNSFQRKLQVLKSHLNDNIFHFFPSCQIFLEEHDNNYNFKEYIHFLDSLRRIWYTVYLLRKTQNLILFEINSYRESPYNANWRTASWLVKWIIWFAEWYCT